MEGFAPTSVHSTTSRTPREPEPGLELGGVRRRPGIPDRRHGRRADLARVRVVEAGRVAQAAVNRSRGMPGPGIFIGIENYEYLADDAVFWLSVFNTLLYTISASILKFALGLWLALLALPVLALHVLRPKRPAVEVSSSICLPSGAR